MPGIEQRAKSRPARGTWEDDAVAFQLSLRSSELRLFPSAHFPYLAVPTVGTYGDGDYQTAPPIVLLDLPAHSVFRLPSIDELVSECLDQGALAPGRGSLQVLLQLHAGLQRAPCFVCGGLDCFNVVLHAWLFAGDLDADADGGAPNLHDNVLCGIYEARGVQPAHAGESGLLGPAPFARVSLRNVHLHDHRFSPNNLHVQLAADTRSAAEPGDAAAGSPAGGCSRSSSAAPPLDANAASVAAEAAAPPCPPRTSTHRQAAAVPGDNPTSGRPSDLAGQPRPLDRDRADIVTFVSFALDPPKRRGVVTLHVLPVGDGPADWVREWVKGCDTLGDLLGALAAHLPRVHATLRTMLDEWLEPEGGDAGDARASCPRPAGDGGEPAPPPAGDEDEPGRGAAATGKGAALQPPSFTGERAAACTAASPPGAGGANGAIVT